MRPYRPADRDACLRIFDSNVPDYFLASDRDDFERFLDAIPGKPVRYFVIDDVACGGIWIDELYDARMCWGMVHRTHHRTGLGKRLLRARLAEAKMAGAKTASLATVRAVEGFFVKEGFTLVRTVDDGYGAGIDRREYRMDLASWHPR